MSLIAKISPVVIDFETYYDAEYSLSAKMMTTQQYIRDERFEVIGVGVKEYGREAVFYTGAAVPSYLHSLELNNRAVVAHNAAFDGSILSYIYGIKPKLLIDTMSLMRPLGLSAVTNVSLAACAKLLRTQGIDIADKGDDVIYAKGKSLAHFTVEALAEYGEYCKHDCDIAMKLLEWQLSISDNLDLKSELLWQDLVLRMHTEPQLVLDKAMIDEELISLIARQKALLDTVGKTQKELGSNEVFAQMLLDAGAEPPVKTSPTTGKEVYAFAKTDAGMQALAESEDELVTALVQARLATKSTIQQTRCERFLKLAELPKLGVPYKIHGALTGRLSGDGGFNAQNLPSGRIKGQSNALRRSIMAPEGFVLLAFDISAIEPRVLSYLANDYEMLDIFLVGDDPYIAMASKIYKVDAAHIKADRSSTDLAIKKVADLRRAVGKAAVLSLGYGSGVHGFLTYCKTVAKVEMTLEFAQLVVDTYRSERHPVVNLWKQCDKALKHLVLKSDGYIEVGTNNGIRYNGTYTIGEHAMPYIRAELATPIYYYGLEATPSQFGYEYSYKRRLGRAVVTEKIYGAKVVENLTQGLAFHYMKLMAVALRREYGYNVAMNVHDEFVLCVPVAEEEAARAACNDVATRNYGFGLVPLAVEVGSAQRYGDC